MAAPKVIIFGLRDLAQLAKYYLEHDDIYEVAAFTAHQAYLSDEQTFMGVPIVPFERVDEIYSPKEYKFFAPITGSKMNQFREEVYLAAKQKGYQFISYVSSKATIFDTKVGENCFILEDNTIQPYVRIGNNVTMWSGNHIGHHSVIHDNVFFTSHVVLSGHCIVEPYSWFGVNSTIRDGLKIAEGTLVSMGACVTKDTEAWKAYMGLPAKLIENKSSMDLNP